MTHYTTRIKIPNQKQKLGVSNKTTVQNIVFKTAKQKFDKLTSQRTTVVHYSTPTFNNDLVFTLTIQLTPIQLQLERRAWLILRIAQFLSSHWLFTKRK